jgi:thiol-disulfide isomerase/thioredoxin
MRVLKIGAAWCSGCIVMKPRWAEIEKELPWLDTHYLDYDDDADLIKDLGIEAETLPTCVFYNDQDIEVKRLSGEVEKKELVETIRALSDTTN